MENKSLNIVDLKSFNNVGYSPGKHLIIRIIWILVNAVFFSNLLAIGSAYKRIILRLFGAKIGKGVVIKPSVNIKYPWNLNVGNYCWIGEGVWIDNLTKITLGNNVCLSQGSMLLSGNHNYKKSSFDLIVKEIVLEDGVWIGAKSVVCPGVKACSHSILSVGSIATNSLRPYTIYQGNPAMEIRERIIQP